MDATPWRGLCIAVFYEVIDLGDEEIAISKTGS